MKNDSGGYTRGADGPENWGRDGFWEHDLFVGHCYYLIDLNTLLPRLALLSSPISVDRAGDMSNLTIVKSWGRHPPDMVKRQTPQAEMRSWVTLHSG